MSESLPSAEKDAAFADRQRRAQQLVREGDMRIEVVKREINQGALAGYDSQITDYAAALVIVALDSFDNRIGVFPPAVNEGGTS